MGDRAGEVERRREEAGCCATESKCYWLFHPAGEATPAPPQLSRQSGTRATGGNLWKDHSPKPQAWKDYVYIMCVGVCEREKERVCMAICSCLCLSDVTLWLFLNWRL